MLTLELNLLDLQSLVNALVCLDSFSQDRTRLRKNLNDQFEDKGASGLIKCSGC